MTSADTRFHNDKVRAQQAQMGNNLSAINSMPMQSGPSHHKKPSGPPVGAQPDNLSQLVPPDAPPIQHTPNPTGDQIPAGLQGFEPVYKMPPQEPVNEAAPVNPVMKRLTDVNNVNNIANNRDTVAAYTRIKLRDHFHNRYSDPVQVGSEVLRSLSATVRKEK